MTLDLSRDEAVLLIAILAGAEGIFPGTSPALAAGLRDLRDFRSRLVHSYVQAEASRGETA